MQRGKAYNFVLLENGQETWYGHGFAPPKFNEGDSVTFTWQPNGNFKNVDARSVQVTPAQQQAPAPTQQAAPAAQNSGRNFGNNQIAIQYQASRNSAISTLGLMLEHNLVSLPSKKADQYDATLALLDDLTTRFHVQTDDVVKKGGVVLEELEQAIVRDGDDF